MYTYTADGLRVAQDLGGVVRTFVWDWATGVPEMLSDGDNLYLVGHDTLGWHDGVAWTYAVPDALGSVRQETDASGEVLSVREWTPFGVEVGGTETGLGYTGEWQAYYMNLTYLRARWYDVQTGRFTSKDPWAGSHETPFTQHAYVYALANPLNFSDPSGWFAVCGDFPKCFVIYITGFMGEWTEENQREFLSRLTGISIDTLTDQGSPGHLIRPFWPGSYPKAEPVIAAYLTSPGEIAMANERRIRYVPISGSDHFGYFQPGKADVIIQTRICKRFYLPLAPKQ